MISRFIILGYLSVFGFLFTGCRTEPDKTETNYRTKELQDLNTVFRDYERLEKSGKYAQLADRITEANADLHSSELYVEAASLYLLAGEMDSSVVLLHKAIDHGMANPSILKKFPELRNLDSETYRRLTTRLDSLGSELHNISNFALESRAMDLFWPYFEKAVSKPDSARQFLKDYVLEGPPEIRDYYAIRYYSTDNMFGQMINGAPEYYTYLRSVIHTDSLTALKGKTSAALNAFKTLYPEAVFPKVFVVPGLLNSGGTASEMGLFIGADMYGRSPAMPVHELSDWQEESIMDFSALPQLILHELMHFQQNYSDVLHEDTVLYKIIEEGVCDFLSELASGVPVNTEQLNHLSSPDIFKGIAMELRRDLYTEDLSLWLYNGGSIEDRPADLGYALGYLITKSYYQNAPDKRSALANLLNTDDMRSILRGSAYYFLLDEEPET
jgi:hypothetical protein